MAANMNSSVEPTNVYGGDEVSALVLDPGFSHTRAGFAGEDVPKSVVPTYYGILGSGDERKLLFGDNAIHTPHGGLDISNPMGKDGIVEDWDVAARVWEYSITSRLTTFKPSSAATNGLNDKDDKDLDTEMEGIEENEKPLEENPLLMSETAWNTPKNRERAIELVMESWGAPAFWTARSSVLAAYAAGKASALVVDVGASTVSVVPVHDGLVLKKGIQKSNLAGNWLSGQVRAIISSQDPEVALIPHYMVDSKTQVDAGNPAQATYKKFANPPSPGFRALEEERVITEFKESVVQLWTGPGRLSSGTQTGNTNEDFLKTQPGRVFEMPDGSNRMWGIERFRAAEGMWDEKAALPIKGEAAVTKAQTIPEMIKTSLAAVDPDIRFHLLQNVVVTGGTTLTNGFTDRLHSELMTLYGGARIKVQAAGITSERRFGSWIGGSIVASLGTFHQMWISKKEYDEHGASIVEKRCK